MSDWIIRVLSQFGYLGVALLMLLENVFPPVPSELIMPFAGFVAARGELNTAGVVLAGSAGSLSGALLWYAAGRLLGAERIRRLVIRYGRWLTISPSDLDRASRWFEKHGRWAVLIGRLVPAVRTLISVPAGLARMPLLPFVTYSAVGTLLWTGLLTLAGVLLRHEYARVAAVINPVTNLIVALIVFGYVYRLLRGTGRSSPPVQ